MNVQVDFERLRLAHKSIHAELLAERAPDGRWLGYVASSPTATAAAVCALVVAYRKSTLPIVVDRGEGTETANSSASSESAVDLLIASDLSELVINSLHWLARRQNPDGGWGDCPGSRSNLAATVFVQSAFRLTGVPAKYADLMAAADRYVTAQGGLDVLRRREDIDKTLAAAALSAGALSGMISWKAVPALPYHELASFTTLVPRWLLVTGQAELNVSAPHLAVSIARHEQRLRRNPLLRLMQTRIAASGLSILSARQAPDGSLLDSPLWTAIVVMNLAGTTHQDHPVVARGVEYLLTSIRSDTSWPIIAEMSIRNTALAVKFFSFEQGATGDHEHDEQQSAAADGADWLCRPADDVANSGQAMVGFSIDAEPNTFDSALVLQALLQQSSHHSQDQPIKMQRRIDRGIAGLVERQSEDGGWTCDIATNCSLSTNSRVGDDVPCEALCALGAWLSLRSFHAHSTFATSDPRLNLEERVQTAISRGFAWLVTHQRDDGSFTSAFFGNENHPDGQNPVYATSRALAAAAAIGRLDTPLVQRAAHWLTRSQHANGGWGPPRAPLDYSGAFRDLGPGATREAASSWRANEASAKLCSVEETAWAVSALLPLADRDPAYQSAFAAGLNWLSAAIENDLHRQPAVVGVWPGKIWYYERLYPLVVAADALSRSLRAFAPPRRIATVSA